ncbi:MAG: EutN/CcmL family microcompartment protein [Planctomycetaceae bacterium]|nr:EutN/CcmL family microcompartment protein [Planctomycetaceae bacterium]
MQLAKVIGRVTATVKHHSLEGWKLLLVQPLGVGNTLDGDPFIAIDNLGSRRGDLVMITSDGASVSEMMGTKNTPVRWATLGIADETD